MSNSTELFAEAQAIQSFKRTFAKSKANIKALTCALTERGFELRPNLTKTFSDGIISAGFTIIKFSFQIFHRKRADGVFTTAIDRCRGTGLKSNGLAHTQINDSSMQKAWHERRR